MTNEQHGTPGGLTIRKFDGDLDELVVHDCDVHLERMADNTWWMGITLADGKQTQLIVNIGAKRARVDAWVELDATEDPSWWADAVSNRCAATGEVIP